MMRLTFLKSKRSKVFLLILALSLTGFSVYLVNSHIQVAPSDSEASNSLYKDFINRKSIVIENVPVSQLKDYPLRIDLSDLRNDIKSDCSDIRFTDHTGRSLPYYLRRCDRSRGQNGVLVNVKVPTIQSNNQKRSVNPIFVHYNNPAAQSQSDGKLVFDYFEDFNSFNPTVNFGVITDVHHDATKLANGSPAVHYWTGPDGEKQMLTDGRPRMKKFVDEMNSKNADFIVQLGDMITSENWQPGVGAVGESVETPQQAFASIQEIESEYKKFKNERYYLFGNHEFYNLTIQDMYGQTDSLCSTAGASGSCGFAGQGAKLNSQGDRKIHQDQGAYYAFSKGGVKFIILDSNFYLENGVERRRGRENSSEYGEGYINKAQLQWVESELASAKGYVVVMSHNRLDNTDYLTPTQCADQRLRLNYCTDEKRNGVNTLSLCNDFLAYRGISNKVEVRNTLKKFNSKILLVLQGHDHINTRSVHDGMHFVTLNAADQESIANTNYTYISIDSKNGLITLQSGNSPTSSYSMKIEGSKLQISNSTAQSFVPALLPIKIPKKNNQMIETEYSVNSPRVEGEQAGIGYWSDLDWLNVRHRCASSGRTRDFNLLGLRRVYSPVNGNGIGHEFTISGEVIRKDIPIQNLGVTSNSGQFWLHHDRNTLNSWYSTTTRSGYLSESKSNVNVRKSREYSQLDTSLYPGVYVFNQTNASFDNIIVRQTVLNTDKSEPYGRLVK